MPIVSCNGVTAHRNGLQFLHLQPSACRPASGGDVVQRFWLGVVVLALGGLLAAPSSAEARRYAAIVVDARTGQVLHEAHADRWVYPASLTKMMTLYMAFEALDQGRLTPGQMLPVSREAAARPPSKLGLRVGQRIAVRDVISALVTRSANDAAVVIAEALGGTEENFARMMTRHAQQHLGMSRTVFRNASGLPDRQQVTTAWDMYRLARALQIHFPRYYSYFSTQQFHYGSETYGNHNALLRTYEGTDGIKTGFIRMSGYNLVASVRRDNHHLIGIVFGGKSGRERNEHLMALFDYSFSRYGIGPQIQRANFQPPTMRSNPETQVAAASPRQSTSSRNQASSRSNTTSVQSPTQWYVQVGTFNARTQAQQQIQMAVQRSTVLRGATTDISPVRARHRTMYQARLVNLNAAQARQACQSLRRAGITCVPGATN